MYLGLIKFSKSAFKSLSEVAPAYSVTTLPINSSEKVISGYNFLTATPISALVVVVSSCATLVTSDTISASVTPASSNLVFISATVGVTCGPIPPLPSAPEGVVVSMLTSGVLRPASS